MSRRPLLQRLNSKENKKHTLIFVTEEDGCRIPQRVRTSSTSSSMHQPMDTFPDGLDRRRISDEAAARYAHTVPVHGLPSLSLSDTPPAPPPPLPQRTTLPRSQLQPPRPARDPVTPPRPPRPSPHRDPPPPRGIITLDQVRSGPRAQNEYVDSPHVAALRDIQPPNKLSQPTSHGCVKKSTHVPGNGVERTVTASDVVDHHTSRESNLMVITAQPQPSGLKKGPSVDDEGHATAAPCTDSGLICSQCKKCRCQACTQPRELPRRWLCSNKCECSLQKLVDVSTCLCCVSACFYHCFKDSEGDECSASDDPCACFERPHCCKRWLCLGLMSLCLPCLCCYPPLKGLLCCCTAIYNKCTLRGCRCRRDKLPGAKRLLIDSESSST